MPENKQRVKNRKVDNMWRMFKRKRIGGRRLGWPWWLVDRCRARAPGPSHERARHSFHPAIEPRTKRTQMWDGKGDATRGSVDRPARPSGVFTRFSAGRGVSLLHVPGRERRRGESPAELALERGKESSTLRSGTALVNCETNPKFSTERSVASGVRSIASLGHQASFARFLKAQTGKAARAVGRTARGARAYLRNEPNCMT